MSDVVKRLRAEGENALRRHLSLGMHQLCGEAADEIERLRAALREAQARSVELFVDAALSGKGES